MMVDGLMLHIMERVGGRWFSQKHHLELSCMAWTGWDGMNGLHYSGLEIPGVLRLLFGVKDGKMKFTGICFTL